MSLGKLIGIGNTANVYEWEEDKVLKLFHQGYPKEAIEKEYNNAVIIRDMNFLKPKAYDMISYGERMGIIYDKVEGETLLEWVMKSGELQKCALYMSNLHKEIMQNQTQDVLNYKNFLKYHMPKTLPSDKHEELLKRIDRLADGNTLCHGDFHPGNILVSDGYAYVIDFMNICYGNHLYDIARTVYLVEFTPVPPEVEDKDMVMQFKKQLANLYLMQMDVTREMIQDYLEVIGEVRKGEFTYE